MESRVSLLRSATLRAAAATLLLGLFGVLPWSLCLPAAVLVGLGDLLLAPLLRRLRGEAALVRDLVARRTAELSQSAARLAEQAREYQMTAQAMRRRAQELQQALDAAGGRTGEHAAALRRQAEAHAAHLERLRAEHDDRRTRLEQEQHEALARLAGGIAGDFHETFRTIAGTVNLLLARPDVPGEAAAGLAQVRAAVLAAARRAARLDEYARGGRIGALRELVDLEELLADVAVTAQGRLGADVFLAHHVAGRPFALGDAAELREVLLALVEHAAGALAPGGQLTLAAEAGDLGLRITVADSGPAPDDETLRRCFLPYGAPAGGLTLAWCRATLRRHGGELEAGRTPRFTLTLPAADLSMASTPQAA